MEKQYYKKITSRKIIANKIQDFINYERLPRTMKDWQEFHTHAPDYLNGFLCYQKDNHWKSLKNKVTFQEYEEKKDQAGNYRRELGSNKPFVDLPLRLKRQRFNKIKKLIKEMSNQIGNGYFYTNHLICDKDGRSNGTIDEISKKENLVKFSWLDFYFLSKKYKNTFYNATITTSYNDIFCDIDEMSFDIDYGQKKKIITDTDYQGHVTKDKSYRYGIGLNIVISDKKNFTIEDIENFIQEFIANNEEEIVKGDTKIVGELPENILLECDRDISEFRKTVTEFSELRDVIRFKENPFSILNTREYDNILSIITQKMSSKDYHQFNIKFNESIDLYDALNTSDENIEKCIQKLRTYDIDADKYIENIIYWKENREPFNVDILKGRLTYIVIGILLGMVINEKNSHLFDGYFKLNHLEFVEIEEKIIQGFNKIIEKSKEYIEQYQDLDERLEQLDKKMKEYR